MTLKAAIIVSLATFLLIECYGEIELCPYLQGASCPNSWPVRCKIGSSYTYSNISGSNGLRSCFGCPFCVDDLRECPNIPMRRQGPESMIAVPDGCQNPTVYFLDVKLRNGLYCYAGETYSCE